MPSPSPAPRQAQISLSFNQADHALAITFSRVKQVLYTIRYEVPLAEGTAASASAELADRVSTTQGITNRGTADQQGRFTASHVLGTASGEDTIQHQIKEGYLQATIIATNNERERLTKRFVIEESGKVTLFDHVATASTTLATPSAVLGASTQPSPSLAPVPLTITKTATPQAGRVLGAFSDISPSVWLIGIGVMLMVAIAIYSLFRLFQAKAATAAAN